MSYARAVNPDLKFAIANIPQGSHIRGREDLIESTKIVNRRLPGAIEKWTMTQSPIHLVDVTKAYDCAPEACLASSYSYTPFIVRLAGNNSLQ